MMMWIIDVENDDTNIDVDDDDDEVGFDAG
jgi:hypothetical protein